MPDVKNLDTPDEKRGFDHGELAVVTVGNATVTRATFAPGWRWSRDVAPAAGTASCPVEHLTYVVSGRMHIRMDDGAEYDLGPGDVGRVPPGHDAWVLGDEALVGIDFAGGAAFADASNPQVRTVSCPCGVDFRIEDPGALDHLVDAVQQHAASSHGHDVTRAHILDEMRPAG